MDDDAAFWNAARLLVGAGLSVALLSEMNKPEQQAHDELPPSSSSSSAPSLIASAASASTDHHATNTTSCEADAFAGKKKASEFFSMRRQTIRRLDAGSTEKRLESKYDVDWAKSIGEGSFGIVYKARNKETGELVALKKIPKKFTKEKQIMGEMNALLHLRQAGGHPGICALRDYFNESGHYYLVLDFIGGGELFDHLVDQGAYSEADAAHLIREVASTLNFLHGLDVVHADMKPENLMMSSKNPASSAIKLVDFGCSQVTKSDDDDYDDDDDNDSDDSDSDGNGRMGKRRGSSYLSIKKRKQWRKRFTEEEEKQTISLAGKTIAYCPPEILDDKQRSKLTKLDPSVDMWALGIILYIMLTGVHPYDLNGQASDDEVRAAINSGRPPPLRNSPITAHLSESAIDLIEKLMCRNPKKRLNAFGLLQHDWVRGKSASTSKMVASGKKLSYYKDFKHEIQRTAFEMLVQNSKYVSGDDNEGSGNQQTNMEKIFKGFDKDGKGHISEQDVQHHARRPSTGRKASGESETLTISGLSSLLHENMIPVHFLRGQTVYREGDIGNRMYFINSGTVTVETRSGFFSPRSAPAYFGEGSLFDPSKRRSATVRCETPVHTLSIDREYFEKYLEDSDPNLFLELRETDKIRKRNRTRYILGIQNERIRREYRNGEFLFRDGDDGDSIYIVKEGKLDIEANGKNVLTAEAKNVIGEHALLTGQPRNCSAICAEKTGCVVYQLMGPDVRRLMEDAPYIKTTMKEMCIRRDFKKAVVLRLNKEFPYNKPHEAFDAIKIGDSEFLDAQSVGSLMRGLHPYTDEEIDEIIRTIDLNHSGSISYDEFKKVFIADKRGSKSM
mmetsp:Transcript_18186/g.51792  ORF Transcript_18186/g.51792 Transcript_18186/m.51792 type:complete len:845 (-) Transcript_18186:187-2721(-)